MSATEDQQRMRQVLRRLKKAYPDARLALHFRNPLELLVALILAAQCTDEKVNQVTRTLFDRYRTAQDYARADLNELEKLIHPTGFFRQKARTLQKCCQTLLERFHGEVPDRLEDLLELPGVGRKTANILLGNAFGKPAIGVDTHVMRLAQRLGFTRHKDPDKIEQDLNQLVPVPERTRFCHLMQTHGRQVCLARKPKCGECVLNDLCPYPNKTAVVSQSPPAKHAHKSRRRSAR